MTDILENAIKDISDLMCYLIYKEKYCNDYCKHYLESAKSIFENGDTEKIQTLIQDYNYAQGQRNICRIILREFFGKKINGPDYEILGVDE